MPQAIWKDTVLAESDETVVVEGNHYFPPESLDDRYFKPSAHTSVCPWKGIASYYDIHVDGQENRNAAWTYPNPSKAARHIKGYVAFWHGVKVVGDDGGVAAGGLVDRLRRLVGLA